VGKTKLYRFFDADRNLLYVGISLSVVQRLQDHLAEKPWIPDNGTLSWTTYLDRSTAEQAERVAIRVENPRHNKVHKPGWKFTGEFSLRQHENPNPADLAHDCIRNQGKVIHWRKCKMIAGGPDACKWETSVVQFGFCCRKSFNDLVRKGLYRSVMSQYLEALMKYEESKKVTSVLLLDGTEPEVEVADCGTHGAI